MTKRPEIKLENYRDVYDYFEASRLKPRFNAAIFRAARALYAPIVQYDQQTWDAIAEQHEQGKAALIAMNHPSYHDPFVAAATMNTLEHPALQEFTGYAKDSLFRGPVRPIFEYTGCVPVFRKKTYSTLNNKGYLEMNDRLHNLAVHRIREGRTVAILPEGTRSHPDERDQLKLGSIKAGIARLAAAATDERSYIIPIGIRYRHDKISEHNIIAHRRPIVTLGEPILDYADDVDGIREQVHLGINAALGRSVDTVKTMTN